MTVQELGRDHDELNAFGSSAAHDLRSPLRSIDGFSYLVRADDSTTFYFTLAA